MNFKLAKIISCKLYSESDSNLTYTRIDIYTTCVVSFNKISIIIIFQSTTFANISKMKTRDLRRFAL